MSVFGRLIELSSRDGNGSSSDDLQWWSWWAGAWQSFLCSKPNISGTNFVMLLRFWSGALIQMARASQVIHAKALNARLAMVSTAPNLLSNAPAFPTFQLTFKIHTIVQTESNCYCAIAVSNRPTRP